MKFEMFVNHRGIKSKCYSNSRMGCYICLYVAHSLVKYLNEFFPFSLSPSLSLSCNLCLCVFIIIHLIFQLPQTNESHPLMNDIWKNISMLSSGRAANNKNQHFNLNRKHLIFVKHYFKYSAICKTRKYKNENQICTKISFSFLRFA